MRMGMKTLLFGCHQFILHPLFTWRGWWKMYGKPPRIMWLAFLIHDWGYWFMGEIDGDKDHHSYWAALSVAKHNPPLAREMMLHSRFAARELGQEPSRLCWADKMGTALMPSFLWAVLARLSGEGFIYMGNQKYEINQGLQYDRSISGLIRFHYNYRVWAWREVWPRRRK